MLSSIKRAVVQKGKSQIFYGDLLIALTIFVSAVILYFALNDDASLSEGKVLSVLVADSEAIQSSLLSAGNPKGWTIDNVTTIGLTDGSVRLNATKVNMLLNMSSNATNQLFGTNANYAIFFRNKQGDVLFFDRCVFSNTDLVVQNISSTLCQNVTVENQTSLVSSERLVVHDLEIVKLVVYVWV